MDDDLLADDGQYKDEGLDDLDIDEEAALLGLSDEEIEGDRITGRQDLEYVDEDGNPVEIGESNAGLYEVAKYHSNKNRSSTPTEDDVLDLDVDAELESFTEENPDLRESPANTFNDRHFKDNLIPLTSYNKQPAKSHYSPDQSLSRPKIETSYSSQRQVSIDNVKMEYDEESEDEDDDDRRERFKSERSNIITLTPAKNRDIPDTLESVVNEEETKKVQAFLENEQKRKMRYRGGNSQRMRGHMRQNRPHQPFPNVQHQPPQYSSPAPPQQQPYQHQQTPQQSSSSQPRKILINPHFRGGLRQAPPTETSMPPNQNQQVSAPPPMSYNPPPNFASPVGYADHSHQVNVAQQAFNTPPPAMQYNHPEYHQPQQPVHIQQIPPPIWQTSPPPEMHPPPVSYANQPPPINYGDPMNQSYHGNYNPNYQSQPYSNQQIPPLQMAPPTNMNYSQAPPTVHMHPPPQEAYTTVSPRNVMHFKSSPPDRRQNVQQNNYQDQRKGNQTSHNFQRNNNNQNQHFKRAPEKRPSSENMKQLPKKQPRFDHPPRKNLHVNNSNIREIPLVDTIKSEPVASVKTEVRKPPVVEEEDEKTRELRLKIEEQKLLREQILKRKEERRRQMAAQRLMDMQKRQTGQNQTINVVSTPRVEQKTLVHTPVQIATKINVRERIGVPSSNRGQAAKKKIVVVRKKTVQPATAAPAQQRKVIGMTQRFGNQPTKQQPQKQQQPPQKIPLQKKIPITAPTTQKPPMKTEQTTKLAPTNQLKQPITTKKVNPPNKTLATTAAKKILAKTKPNAKQANIAQQKQKGNILQRLGNRGFNPRLNFHQRLQAPRPPPSPRFNGPRPPPPFMEHRMRFPGPMHDMGPPLFDQGPPHFDQGPPHFEPGPPHFDQRPPPFEQRPPHFEQGPPMFEDGLPPFRDERLPPFENARPPLLPFNPRGERPPFNRFRFEGDRQRFRMQGAGFDEFRPMRMDMFADRFPRPQFPNQMMRPRFERNSGPMFQRPQSPSQPRPKQNNQPKKTPVKHSPVKTSPSPVKPTIHIKKEVMTPPKAVQQTDSDTPVDNKNISVCVENLSSSTSELQLKKLCLSVGVVESIQLIKNDRKAVIKFKEPSQAINFQKKFQRYMLDLSMIQVSLISI